MKWLALVVAISACKGGSSPKGADEATSYSATAGELEPDPAPSYSDGELQRVLIAERGLEAKNERELIELELAGDGERLPTAIANLKIRRRFIATLELCEAAKRMCPPRLEEPALISVPDSGSEPKLDAPLRFDVASWQTLAAELQARACACRTLECIDSMDNVIARLEVRPMAEVQADDKAIESVTRARECLFRLRGKKQLPRLARD